MISDLTKRSEYVKLLNELKERIRIAQTKAVLTVNRGVDLSLLGHWQKDS